MSRPVPLDSYGRSVTGGHYDCWVYSIHDGVKYVDYGEGPKRLEIIKQPSFDYDPSIRRISNEYHSSLTCISKILRGRGTEGCGYVMDEDGYMDLEDLGLALCKELRHPIPWNIQNIMDIFKLNKKQRFIVLGCPDASRCGDVPCSHWIFKIKASQGHEDWLQIDDSGIAKEWYVNPGTDLGRWSGWNHALRGSCWATKTRACTLFGLTGRSAESSWVLKWLESLGEAVAQSISEPFSLPEPDFIMPVFALTKKRTQNSRARFHTRRPCRCAQVPWEPRTSACLNSDERMHIRCTA